MSRARIVIFAATAVVAFAALTGSSSAASIYHYETTIDQRGVNQPTAGGTVTIGPINSLQDIRVVVNPPSGPSKFDNTQSAGSDRYTSSYIAGLAPGDTIVVRQPSVAVTATESFTIPQPTLNVVTGASALTGTVPAGSTGSVTGDYRCNLRPSPQAVAAGSFSLPYRTIIPGEIATLAVRNSTGDWTKLTATSPGETPCVNMFAGASSAPPVGGTGENPYTISVNHLITSFQPSVRVVLRRGAQILTDNSVSGSSSYASFTTRPLPGDVVDVYRPQGAATPAFSATIPQMSGKFDPVADLAAIDAPAAGEEFVYPCRLHGCPFEIPRIATDRPAGRTIFDFAHSQGGFAKVDLRPDDATNGFWIDPTFTLSFGFALTAGDLVAPAQSFKLPTKLKISTLAKALKKGYKIKLTSNEAGSAKLKLGKLASVTGSVKPGSNSLKLKFSKSGKKAIKKLAAQGKHAKSRSISLTSVVTDASGNASTIVKKTKLKP